MRCPECADFMCKDINDLWYCIEHGYPDAPKNEPLRLSGDPMKFLPLLCPHPGYVVTSTSAEFVVLVVAHFHHHPEKDFIAYEAPMCAN